MASTVTGPAVGDETSSQYGASSFYGGDCTMGLLNRLFASCSANPKTSIHRAWGLALIFLVIFFVVAVIEMVNLKADSGSRALMLAALMTGLVHMFLGVLGTFVLKRFPTSFAVGFFLGILLILANQNMILMGTFHRYKYGSPRTNHAFAQLGFLLFMTLAFFSLMLFHFKDKIIVAAIDTKHHKMTAANSSRGTVETNGDSTLDYERYEDA